MSRLHTLRVARARLVIWLELATICYVGFPVLIWALGWLRATVSVPLSLAVLYAAARSWTQTRNHYSRVSDAYEPPDLSLWSVLGCVGVAAIWGLYSGAGGFSFHDPDWIKHFAVLRDLTELKWPVSYQVDGKVVPLVYYLAYYLPAAVVGAHFGWWWGCLTLLVWTCLGTVIAAMWFALLVGSRPVLAGLYFVVANGLDFIGERIVNGGPMPEGMAHTDWWAGWVFVNFPGHYSQLTWAPQHSLATWSITGLLAVQLSARRGLSHAGFLVALLSFWSPFAAIGFVPVAVFALVRERVRGLLSFANGVGVLLLLLNAAYLTSQTMSFPQGMVMQNPRDEWTRLALFHLLEWGAFALFASELRRSQNPRLRGIFWTALAGLLIIPCYRLGFFNDWCMRVSIPSLFLLWAGVGRSLLRRPFNVESRLLLALCIVGALGSLREAARGLFSLPSNPPPMEEAKHIGEIDEGFARQYLGADDTLFFTYLARPRAPLVTAVSPVPPPPPP